MAILLESIASCNRNMPHKHVLRYFETYTKMYIWNLIKCILFKYLNLINICRAILCITNNIVSINQGLNSFFNIIGLQRIFFFKKNYIKKFQIFLTCTGYFSSLKSSSTRALWLKVFLPFIIRTIAASN